MRRGIFKTFLDESRSYFDAAMKIEVTVSFRENRQPVAESQVILADARLGYESAPGPHLPLSWFRRGPGEITVVISPEPTSCEHCFGQCRHHFFAMISEDPRIHRRIERDRIGQVIAVVGAI